MINLKIYCLFFLLLFVITLSFSTYIVSSSPVEKVTLVRFAELVWIKVSATFPSELVAIKYYNISISVKLIEVDGSLKRFFIKGIRVTIGNEYVEYVPDKPLEFKKVGDTYDIKVQITPKFFASNLVPGDIKETVIKIDFAYYVEGLDTKGGEIIEAGLYTVFGNIPVRIIVPKTYVYVQPEVNVTYEPSYIINFTVRVWIEGEGYVENVRVEIQNIPVQCYLLTTGRMLAGETKALWTIMNVTKLGALAQEEYDATILVHAITPWGYVYEYTYPFKLKLLKVRRVSASLPNNVIAYAYTPISISLIPEPESKEVVTISVSFDGEPVYTTTYPAQFLPLALSEGIGLVKIALFSELQAPTFVTWKIKAVKVKPELNVAFSPLSRSLSIEVRPLFVSSRVIVSVMDKEGNTVFLHSIPESALSKSQTLIGEIPVLKGHKTISLPELKAGEYTIRVTYSTPLGSVSEDIKYTVEPKSLVEQLASSLSFIPLPTPLNLIFIVGIMSALVVSIVVVLLRKRKKASEEVESSEW